MEMPNVSFAFPKITIARPYVWEEG